MGSFVFRVVSLALFLAIARSGDPCGTTCEEVYERVWLFWRKKVCKQEPFHCPPAWPICLPFKNANNGKCHGNTCVWKEHGFCSANLVRPSLMPSPTSMTPTSGASSTTPTPAFTTTPTESEKLTPTPSHLFMR